MRPSARTRLCALVIGVVCLVYARTLSNGFTFDDIDVVAKNRHIRHWANVRLLFGLSYFSSFAESSYRPLLTLTYFIDWSLGRGAAGWFHLTNMALHAANACLVLRTCCAAGLGGGVAAFAALLFALHPVVSEVTCGIAFREDALALFFMLVSLSLLTGETNRRAARIAGLASFALALLAKEVALVLPAVVAAYDVVVRRQRKRTSLYAGLAVVVALYAVVRFGVLPGPAQPPKPIPMLASAGRAVGGSASMLLLPIHLAPDHAGTPVFPKVGAAALLAVGIAIVGGAGRRSAMLGVAWLVLMLAPTSGIVPIRNLVAERHAYAAAAGFCLALASMGACRASATRLVVLMLSFTLLTTQRCFAWRDSFSLWTAAVRTTPNSFRALSNLARETARETSPSRAVMLARRGRSLAPDEADAHANLGVHLLAAGRYRSAEASLRRAVAIDPAHAKAHGWLVETLERQGDLNAAVRACEEAVRRAPDYAVVHNQHGRLLARAGRTGEAVRAFESALRADPSFAPAHNNLAGCLVTRGKLREAADHYDAAIRADPKLVEPYVNLAQIHARLGNAARARAFMQAALRLDPSLAKRLSDRAQRGAVP